MKMKLITLFVLCATGQLATLGQTNFYEEVSQMWYAGLKTNVLNIAHDRLAIDTNDIAGLILKHEYATAFLAVEDMTNTAARILEVGADITSTNFVIEYGHFVDEVAIMEVILNEYTPEELEHDRQKGYISGKPMTFGDMIKSLQDDGYFDE